MMVLGSILIIKYVVYIKNNKETLMLKSTVLFIIILSSTSALATQFIRTALEYNNISGIAHVRGDYPSGGVEYIVPLSDSTDNKLRKIKWGQCIIIKGSKNNDIFYARDVKECPKPTGLHL